MKCQQKYHIHIAQPKHWVTNGSQDKLIDRSVLDTFIKDGWIIGRSQQKIKTKERTLRICEKQTVAIFPKRKIDFAPPFVPTNTTLSTHSSTVNVVYYQKCQMPLA